MAGKIKGYQDESHYLNEDWLIELRSVADPFDLNGKLVAPDSRDVSAGLDSCLHNHLKWTWSCRALDPEQDYQLIREETPGPRVGDIALVQVEAISNHTRIMTTDNERLRLYPDDVLVGVFGNRYATDAFEAEVRVVDELHLLTSAGMIGTVCSKHQSIKMPTQLSFLGYLTDETGQRLNLKDLQFRPTVPHHPLNNIIFTVGTGMNSGKTTTTAKLVKALLRKGLRVAACKLTGSVSHRDLYELRATAAHDTRDFSDYGFPSTYLCSQEELVRLFYTMMTDASRVRPDVTVVEIADGVLQRETRLLLESTEIRRQVSGVVLSAPCALSAIKGVEQIGCYGHKIVAVSGIITNSPLFVREFLNQSSVRVGSSVGTGDDLAELVMEHLQVTSRNSANSYALCSPTYARARVGSSQHCYDVAFT